MLQFTIPMVLYSGLANRMRGGFIPLPGTQITRARFALMLGLLFLLSPICLGLSWHATLYLTLGSILAIFASCFMPPGHGAFMGISNLYQFLMMGVSGLTGSLPMTLNLWLMNHYGLTHFDNLIISIFSIFGLTKGVCYWLGKVINWPFHIEHFSPGPEMGEVIYGMIGWGIPLSLLFFYHL